jgi:prepilin signal peptidase PulO-like enzyme (type II secretory pathway)
VFGELPAYVPYVPLGWWMGYRFGWGLLGLALAVLWRQDRRRAGKIGLAAAAAMIVVTFVSADLTRSTNLLLPLLLAGLLAGQRALGPAAFRLALAAAAAGNLLTPFAWITYNKISPVWPLPLELWRVWR